jgi:hypothetical protein
MRCYAAAFSFDTSPPYGELTGNRPAATSTAVRIACCSDLVTGRFCRAPGVALTRNLLSGDDFCRRAVYRG